MYKDHVVLGPVPLDDPEQCLFRRSLVSGYASIYPSQCAVSGFLKAIMIFTYRAYHIIKCIMMLAPMSSEFASSVQG